MGFHPLKPIVEKPVGGEKFRGDEGLHGITPQVVV